MTGKDTRPYIAVTNELFRHPKFKRLRDPLAKLYLIELWTYANQYLTDGWVDHEVLHEKGEDVAEALRSAGWIDGPDQDGMFYLHDYLEHQKSKAEIEGLRSTRKELSGWANHTRWHVSQSVVESSCGYCTGELPPPERVRKAAERKARESAK